MKMIERLLQLTVLTAGLLAAGCVSVDDIKVPSVTQLHKHEARFSEKCQPETSIPFFKTVTHKLLEIPYTRVAKKHKPAGVSELLDAIRTIPVKQVSCVNVTSRRKWRYIIIHHTAGTHGNAQTIGNYHKKVRHWRRGLGYHFVIGNGTLSGDGKIEAGPRWRRQQSGAHAGVNRYNREGIGIGIIGNFEKKLPSVKQLASLRDLIYTLCRRYRIPLSNVRGHGDIKCTKCPGRYFPMEAFLDELNRIPKLY